MEFVSSPLQKILVTSRSNVSIIGKENEKDFIVSTIFHSPISNDPENYFISIKKNHNICRAIKESGFFIVNFMPDLEKNNVSRIDSMTSFEDDVFSLISLTPEESSHFDCAKIKEASAIIECKLTHELEIGERKIFIGEVVNAQHINDAKRLMKEKDYNLNNIKKR
jgi:flavin reductase (DIM6/NTAB) family NADH-FMN oxidoreductase RutF